MIDLRFLRDNPDAVRASQQARGEDVSLVDAALAADAKHRTRLAAFEQLRSEQKAFGKKVASAPNQDKAALVAQAKGLAEQVKAAESDADRAQGQLMDVVLQLSNVVEEGAPSGDETHFEVIREVGRPRDFGQEGFTPRPHEELGEIIGGIDIERGAKVSGSRFYFLTGVGARLEHALLSCAWDKAIAAGFNPLITPTLVKPEVMAGTGFLGAHAPEVYRLEADDLYLTGTSEVALAGFHSGEILDLSAGPERLAGWSACYRREAGSHGKDTRGIYRVHQFHKVEMFSFVRIEDAHAEHERLLAFEEDMLQAAELPYRVIDIPAGDLGASAARKYDCEAWIPSQERYREMTSTSNCTTFQARRLAIRERLEDGTIRPAATLNGTFATTRWLVALLENHQLADGSVRVPEALRPYMGGLEVMPAIAA